jgi:hypothetical protein
LTAPLLQCAVLSRKSCISVRGSMVCMGQYHRKPLSRGASPTRSSEASWRIRRQPRAAPLDKEEPRTPLRRSSRGSLIYLIAPVRRANSMRSPNTSGGYYQSLMYRPRHKLWVLPEVGEEHGPRARTPSQAAVWLLASSPSAAMAARFPPLGISGSPNPHR